MELNNRYAGDHGDRDEFIHRQELRLAVAKNKGQTRKDRGVIEDMGGRHFYWRITYKKIWLLDAGIDLR